MTMPFSWDQIIPGHQQTFKQKTIKLYIDENRRLDGTGGVREFMKEQHNFDKSVSTYRREFTKWGIKKNDYPTTVHRSSQHSVDSGYATASNRSSSATASSFDPVSPLARQSRPSLLRLSLQNQLSSNPPISYSRPQSHQSDTEVYESHFANTPIDHSDANQYTAHDYLSHFYDVDQPLHHQQPPSGPPAVEHISYTFHRPPHAPPSRCSRAGASSGVPDLGLETCQNCSATKLHHLASISRRTDLALFKEVVRSNLGCINDPDDEGNLCMHFAAGAGASMEQLAILQHAGADIVRPNHSGQTILHILDPQVYSRKMPAIITFATQHGVGLAQRDCNGRTPLHNIFSRTITLTNVHDLMPFMKAAASSMTSLDRHGNTPLDILRDNWQKANHGVHLPQLEAKLVAFNIPLAFRKPSGNPLKLPSPMLDFSKLAITSQDDTSSDILNVINRSQHEPYFQDRSGRNVLHALAAFSFHANYQISCYMSPCGVLECLQQRLQNLANVGVDINQYNSDGLTPLHCFLTATFDINLDIPWLVPECVKWLLQFGADPKLRDHHGNTALHLACNRGRFECVGKIVSHLSHSCGKAQYMHCLSAVNHDGKTVVEHAEASMGSETSEANDRRKQCIGLLRAALGEPLYSYMPAASLSAMSSSSTVDASVLMRSAQLPNHGRKPSNSPSRPSSWHRKVPSWSLRTSSVDETRMKMSSAFED